MKLVFRLDVVLEVFFCLKLSQDASLEEEIKTQDVFDGKLNQQFTFDCISLIATATVSFLATRPATRSAFEVDLLNTENMKSNSFFACSLFLAHPHLLLNYIFQHCLKAKKGFQGKLLTKLLKLFSN